MRLIQTLVPEGKRQLVIDLLEDAEIDYAMTSETSRGDYSDIVYIPTDVDSVEGILDELRDVGVEREGYMIVSDVETIVSDRFEQQQADDEADEETNGVAEDERISREELQTKAQNLSRSTTNYIALTLISAIVATAGLLQDSAAVVVGSMVIAPLIGPAMASCVGTVVSDDALFWEGMRSQAIGLAVAGFLVAGCGGPPPLEPLADAARILGDAREAADMGRDFGATLTEAEVRWLIAHEYVRTAEDVVWRRSRLGLRLGADEVAALDDWIARERAGRDEPAGDDLLGEGHGDDLSHRPTPPGRSGILRDPPDRGSTPLRPGCPLEPV